MLACRHATSPWQGEKKRAADVVKVAQAANAYGKRFDHAGWQTIKLPH